MANKGSFRRLGPSMYFKEHKDVSSSAIFLVNIPVGSKFVKESIEAAFSSFGHINKVTT
jgi:hypothetical protein